MLAEVVGEIDAVADGMETIKGLWVMRMVARNALCQKRELSLGELTLFCVSILPRRALRLSDEREFLDMWRTPFYRLGARQTLTSTMRNT